jgi:N-acetylated-alpha-linked acidic dipeptidase
MQASTLRRTACIVCATAVMAHLSHAQTILGFTAAATAKQAEIETQFKAIPTPAQARRQLRIFTAQPHPAGSDRNNELARYIASEWKKQGLQDIVVRRYDVFSSDPEETILEMVAPAHYRAALREAPYDQDPDSKNPNISAAWIGMSKSGDITAPVIYAHSGNPDDFALLRKNGIDPEPFHIRQLNARIETRLQNHLAVFAVNGFAVDSDLGHRWGMV